MVMHVPDATGRRPHANTLMEETMCPCLMAHCRMSWVLDLAGYWTPAHALGKRERPGDSLAGAEECWERWLLGLLGPSS